MKPINVTVQFDEGLDPNVQGRALLMFEEYLRKLSGLDCRVFKEKMKDDVERRVTIIKGKK